MEKFDSYSHAKDYPLAVLKKYEKIEPEQAAPAGGKLDEIRDNSIKSLEMTKKTAVYASTARDGVTTLSEQVRALDEQIKGLNEKLAGNAHTIEEKNEKLSRVEQQLTALYAFTRYFVDVLHNQVSAREGAKVQAGDQSSVLYDEFNKLFQTVVAELKTRCFIEVINPRPVEDAFNAKLHNAVDTKRIEGVPAGRIAEVVSPGFIYDMKVTYAKVIVTE